MVIDMNNIDINIVHNKSHLIVRTLGRRATSQRRLPTCPTRQLANLRRQCHGNAMARAPMAVPSMPVAFRRQWQYMPVAVQPCQWRNGSGSAQLANGAKVQGPCSTTNVA